MPTRYSPFAATWRRIETHLAGPLDDPTRYNMRVEIASAMIYGVFMAALLFVPAVLTNAGGSPALISLYISLSYLGHVFSSVGLIFLRWLPPKVFSVSSWAIGRLAFVVMAFATDTTLLLAFAAVLWLLEILPNPAYTRILQGIYPIEHRGKIMALVRFGMALAILVFTPMMGWALDQFGYRVVFLLAGVAGVVAALLFIKIHVKPSEATTAPPRAPADTLRRVMRNKRFSMLQLGLILFGLASLTATPLYPDVQINRLALSYTTLGLLGLAQSLSWLIGYFLWGRVVDEYGGLVCTWLTFAVSAIAPLTYAVATEEWMLIPAFIGIGLVSAGADIGLTNSCLELSEPERTQEYAATQSTVIGLRGLVGPFIGVGLLAAGFAQSSVFMLAGVMAALSAWVVVRAQRMPAARLERSVEEYNLRTHGR